MGPFKLCRRVRVRTWIFFRLALMVRGPNSRRLAADWLRRLSENSKAHGFLALRNRPLSGFLLLTPTILLFARPTRQYRQDGEYPYSSIAASSIAPHHRHAHPLAPLLPTGHLLVSTALQDRLRILAPDCRSCPVSPSCAIAILCVRDSIWPIVIQSTSISTLCAFTCLCASQHPLHNKRHATPD